MPRKHFCDLWSLPRDTKQSLDGELYADARFSIKALCHHYLVIFTKCLTCSIICFFTCLPFLSFNCFYLPNVLFITLSSFSDVFFFAPESLDYQHHYKGWVQRHHSSDTSPPTPYLERTLSPFPWPELSFLLYGITLVIQQFSGCISILPIIFYKQSSEEINPWNCLWFKELVLVLRLAATTHRHK